MTALSGDALNALRFIQGALGCLDSLTLTHAGRLGICLDVLGNLRELMLTHLLWPYEEMMMETSVSIPDEAWTALGQLRGCLERLPTVETEWIDTAVGMLRAYD